VQCPDGTHAHGVGALNCSVLSPLRLFLCDLSVAVCFGVMPYAAA